MEVEVKHGTAWKRTGDDEHALVRAVATDTGASLYLYDARIGGKTFTFIGDESLLHGHDPRDKFSAVFGTRAYWRNLPTDLEEAWRRLSSAASILPPICAAAEK